MAKEYLSNNMIVGFKKEVTPGTFLAPTAPDYDIELSEVTFERNPNMTRRGKVARGDQKMPASTSSFKTFTIAGKNELRYSGDELVMPKVFKLLDALGLLVTQDDANPVTVAYNGRPNCDTLSAVFSDLTCGTAPTSADKKASGIAGSVILSCAGVGEPWMFEFTFNGADAGEADGATPIKTLTAIDNGAIEKFLGVVFSLNGVTAYKINSFAIDFAFTASPVMDGQNTSGVALHVITAGDPKATISVSKLPNVDSGLVDALNGDEEFTDFAITGTHFDIAIAASNLSALKDADGDGIVMQDLELEVRDFLLTQKD